MESTKLPTARELEKLPMRAVVAYASRTARRLSADLRGVVPDELLDKMFETLDPVSKNYLIRGSDEASALNAARDIIAAYAAAPSDLQSLKKFLIVFSILDAAFAAMGTVVAAVDPDTICHRMKSVAKAAEKAARHIRVLEPAAVATATAAARQDYELLLRQYGEHNKAIIGGPIDCFDDDS